MLLYEAHLLAVVILERSEESRRETNKLKATLLEDDTVKSVCKNLVVTMYYDIDVVF